MNHPDIHTIDDVIDSLENIIKQTETENDPLGYFAVLYQKVTLKVKEGIETGYFDNGERMEKLDVIFARRYIDAYFAWKENKPVTLSWKQAFVISENKNLLVFQHLLLGMNAHINLDLGLAVAETATKDNIHLLKNDFIRINEILSSLVSEVQHNLTSIWPMLKKILNVTGKADDFLVDFSMKIARNGAWDFANHMTLFRKTNWKEIIDSRDLRVSEKTRLITNPGKWIQFLLWIIRLGERGSVKEKINQLKAYHPSVVPSGLTVSTNPEQQ
ncbi:MAG: DUF5995 family protein [Mariniphaga sp.]